MVHMTMLLHEFLLQTLSDCGLTLFVLDSDFVTIKINVAEIKVLLFTTEE